MKSMAVSTLNEIDLEELERQLRLTGALWNAQEDPISELARLVDAQSAPPLADNVVDLANVRGAREQGVQPTLFDSPPPVALAARAPPDFPAQPVDSPPWSLEAAPAPEAALRPMLDHPFGETAPAPQRASLPAQPPSAMNFGGGVTVDENSAPPRPPRRGFVWRATVGLFLIGGLGAMGYEFGVKYGLPGLTRKPPLILAVDGPLKALPPKQDSATPAEAADAARAGDAKPAKPAAVKIVNSEEQPVDLHLAPPAPPQPPAPAQPPAQAAAAAHAPLAAVPDAKAAAALAPAPSPPLVAPAPSAPVVANAPAPSAPPTAFGEPKRVKTVAVRPDGTLISANGAPALSIAAAAPAPSALAALPKAVAASPVVSPAPSAATPAADAPVSPQATTPKLDFKAKPSVKSTARVTAAKIDTTIPAIDAPLQIAPPTKLEKVAKAAKAKLAESPSPTPISTIAAPTPAASPPTSGSAESYGVQLAAPTVEADAESAMKRLKSKYAAQLGDLEPAIHKADINGHNVFRVRVGAMPKADAVALCDKIKVSGGDGACFVAHN